MRKKGRAVGKDRAFAGPAEAGNNVSGRIALNFGNSRVSKAVDEGLRPPFFSEGGRRNLRKLNEVRNEALSVIADPR
jgi:hypothetical protein